jgi:peptidoglycan/LPS O-acetylase OafA/YrhL
VFTALAGDAFKTSALFFFLYLGAVLGVSFLISKYFEKPIMNRWRRKLADTT